MGFSSVADLAAAEDEGRTVTSSFRKVPSQTVTAGWWTDLSMTAGNPQPNYYASEPLVAAELDPMRGIFHGDDVSPARKYLTGMTLISPSATFAGRFELCDYLLYYPFIDGDSSDEQVLDNTVEMTRYADGVRVMLVAVAPTTGGGTFFYTYRDQAGVLQMSPTLSVNTAATPITGLATSQPTAAANLGSPWLGMASGTTSVNKVESITFTVPAGGLYALVLVKPLAAVPLFEASTAAEITLADMRPSAPEVKPGAYLGLLANCQAFALQTLTGLARFAWDGD
jgi:hypothetical protein